MATRFSIRYKFLAVTTLLLAVCLGTYLLLASYIFKEDKRSLVFDYNRSLVVNLASDLDNFFQSLSDKMQLVAYFHRKDDKGFRRLLDNLLEENKDIVWVGGSEDFKSLRKEFYRNLTYEKTYGLEEEFFTQALLTERPVPFELIQKHGEAIWTATMKKDAPALIGFGKNVIEENSEGLPVRQFAIVAFIRADRIIAALKESRPSESMVVSATGEILAHPDPEALQNQVLKDKELFQKAEKLQLRAQVLKYNSDHEVRFGAFAKAAAGRVLILSSISEETAFKAVNDLVFRSLLFGSILVTFAFLLAIFFSRSLTRPIESLAEGMQKVTDGDLNTNINITSKDEIANLADHFNKMIGELKKSREELEEINRDLEKKVKDRTLQLEERNLAVKEAQEALLHSTRLAAVGEMAGLAAHEVLNPLTSIISKLNDLKLRLQTDRRGEAQFILDLKQSWQGDYESGGFSQLVKAWEAPSSVQPGKSLWQEDLNNLEKVGQNVLSEFDQLIHDSEFLIEESQRINRIIQSLRGMNAAKADVRQFSAHRLCERSITIMADLASKHNVEIQRQFTATEDLVWVDEDEMIQVLTNLIRNAIQSIQAVSRPYQKGQILIKTELDVESKKLILKIRDNGTGIGKETGEKLFSHRFTTKTKTEGTGIGLSLSRRLARGFNGDLKLSWTKPGEGAEFTLEVPLAAEQTARSA